MAGYRRVYDSCYLQADCKAPGSASEPYARQSSMDYLYLYFFDAVGWVAGRAVGLSAWSEVQTCMLSNRCHCHSLSLALVRSRLVLPFWYRLTLEVPDKGPEMGVCVVGMCRSSNPNVLFICSLRLSMETHTHRPDALPAAQPTASKH